MYLNVLFFSALFSSLTTGVTGAACTPVAAVLPQPTLSSGVINPFFPCGLNKASVQSCPNRCYSTIASPNYTNATLLDACFSDAQAAALIASLTHICVKCVVPPRSEVPNSLSNTPTCQPVESYFNNTYPPTVPAKCGNAAHPISQCPWICAAAQTPFEVCDISNTTGTYRLCVRCIPQCSSPVIIFNPPTVPSNFSLSSGSCSEQYGPQEATACPFRCTDPSSGGESYCSLVDLTGVGLGFQTCQKCN